MAAITLLDRMEITDGEKLGSSNVSFFIPMAAPLSVIRQRRGGAINVAVAVAISNGSRSSKSDTIADDDPKSDSHLVRRAQ